MKTLKIKINWATVPGLNRRLTAENNKKNSKWILKLQSLDSWLKSFLPSRTVSPYISLCLSLSRLLAFIYLENCLYFPAFRILSKHHVISITVHLYKEGESLEERSDAVEIIIISNMYKYNISAFRNMKTSNQKVGWLQ